MNNGRINRIGFGRVNVAEAQEEVIKNVLGGIHMSELREENPKKKFLENRSSSFYISYILGWCLATLIVCAAVGAGAGVAVLIFRKITGI